MIGTNIRSIRHLFRLSEYGVVKKIILRPGDRNFEFCETVKTPNDSCFGEKLFMFNNFYSQTNYSHTSILSYIANTKGVEEANKIKGSKIMEFSKKTDFNGLDGFFNEITLLPDSFDSDYDKFLKENAKMISRLCKKYDLDLQSITLKRIYMYTEGSKNFFEWAVGLSYGANCSLRTIYNILVWYENYKQLTKKLSKSTITAYNTKNDVISLIEELSVLRNEKRVNDAINSFNTSQKKLLKANEQSEVDKNTLARFSKLSEAKKSNFIRKVSTIDDYQELMRQMRHVTSIHFDWSKESFMDYIHNVEGINYEVIYETDFVVLVKVSDYETIKQLAKTTNWCISKNKTYWNNYIENFHGKTTQYMIFDFSKIEDDKLSIVGFTTTRNKGITAAHNFINDNLMEEGGNNEVLFIKSYLSKFNSEKSIYNVLNNCGIDINLVANYDAPPYNWDEKSFLNFLYECVDKDNVSIISNSNNKLVVSVCDDNIHYFFGNAYFENFSSDTCEMQHIIFADFSSSKYDPNKLVCATIESGGMAEDYCTNMFNESCSLIGTNFDAKLAEFGVPYDIIRRTNNVNKRFVSAFVHLNIDVVKDCINENSKCFDEAIKDISAETIFNCLSRTTVDYLSFDYLNLFYDNNHTISDYICEDYLADILKSNFRNLRTASRQLYRNGEMELPNEERIEAFYSEKIRSRSDVIYVGSYLIIKKLLEKEVKKDINYSTFYYPTIQYIYDGQFSDALIKDLLFKMIANLNMAEKTSATFKIVLYFIQCGDDEMKDYIHSISEKYSWIRTEFEKVNKTEKHYVTSLAEAQQVVVDAPFDIANALAEEPF